MVRKALFWSFAGQISTLIITFVGSVIITRLLTPRELGVYAVATATTGVLQIFAAFGVGLYVVRETDLTPKTVDAAFTMNAMLSIVLGLLLFATSFAGARFLGEPAVAHVLQLLALTPIIGALAFTPGVMLQRAMQFRGSSVVGTISQLVNTVVTISAAVAGERYMSPAYGSLASSIVYATAMIFIGREHFAIRLSTHGWRRMFGFGMRIMSINGIASAAVRLSDIVVARMLGLSALGLYSRASSLNGLLFGNVYATMTGVVFARLSKAQREGGDITTIYLTGLRIVTGVMGPLLIGLAVLAGPALHLLYGERWLAAAPILSLLLIGQFVSLSFSMNWELFVVRDRLQTQTRLEIARSLVGVATQVIGSLFSLIVVAATSIVDNLISMLIYGRYMPSLADTTRSRLTRIYGEACMLTAVAVAPAMLFMVAIGWSTRPSLFLVVAVIVLGILAWLLTVFRIDHPIAVELRLLIDKIGSRFGSAARSRHAG